MGYSQYGTVISWTESSHNDERDERDAALSAELRRRLDEVVFDETFEPINPMRN